MIYFDATFLVRLYVEEPGYAKVRSLPRRNQMVTSSILGKMETQAAFHRKFREGALSQQILRDVNDQLDREVAFGLIDWLPLSPSVLARIREAFLHLPATIFLRAGDAVHLATASEAGFKEIYSNDRHLLAAAPIFKLKGINPLAK